MLGNAQVAADLARCLAVPGFAGERNDIRAVEAQARVLSVFLDVAGADFTWRRRRAVPAGRGGGLLYLVACYATL